MDQTTASSPAGPPQVPDHELLRRIGGGSYGEVWLARTALGTYRAVKLVYRRSFDHERPYEREFEGIQKFEPISRSHEGLVDVLQVGRNDAAGYFYYVMELADAAAVESGKVGEWESGSGQSRADARGEDTGSPAQSASARRAEGAIPHPASRIPHQTYIPKTLKREVYQRGRLPFDECLQLALALTQALGHLHKHGLIHRDIKPSNIIFVNGVPKLADIGLVAEVGRTMSFVGTEGFIPPEGPGSPQADIYSLGKVLYEIVTGRDRQEFPELPTALRGSPEEQQVLELNAVIVKACAPDLRKRYQSAEEMLADLRLVQSGKSVQRLRFVERRLAIATRVAVAAGILGLLAASAYLYQARQTRLLAEKEARIRGLAEESRQRLVRLHIANGTRAIDAGDLLGSLPWLVEAMRLEQAEPQRVAVHRLRLESILQQAPRLSQVWFGEFWDLTPFSPDGTRIALVRTKQISTNSLEHAVELWDAVGAKLLHGPIIQPKEATATYPRFSPDSRLLAVVNSILVEKHSDSLFNKYSGEIRLLDATTSQLVVGPLTLEGRSGGVAFSPDCRRMITASFQRVAWKEDELKTRPEDWAAFPQTESKVQVWELEQGTLVRELRHHRGGSFAAFRFSPDGRRFAMRLLEAYRNRKQIEVLDTTTWELVGPPTEYLPNDLITDVQFSPDSDNIVVAIGGLGGPRIGGKTMVSDVKSGQRLLSLPHPDGVQMATFSPDGRMILTAGNDGKARRWNASTGAEIRPPLQHGRSVSSAFFSADGGQIVTASADRTARVWEVQTGQAVTPPLFHGAPVYRGYISPKGERILAHGVKEIRLWALPPASTATREFLHGKAVRSVEFSHDSKQLLTTSADGTARVFDVVTSQTNLVLSHSNNFALVYATFSPDDRFAATASEDHFARVWETATGKPITSALEHSNVVWQAQFSPDGRKLVTTTGWWSIGGESHGKFRRMSENPIYEPLLWKRQDEEINRAHNQARVWDVQTGRLLFTLPHLNAVLHAEFSPDSRWIATGSADKTARLWEAETGKPVTPPLTESARVYGARFSPDSRRILICPRGSAGEILDVPTGKAVGSPLRHPEQILFGAWSPKGQSVATAGGDGVARLWDSRTGQQVTPPLPHHDQVVHVNFSPNGLLLATASLDSTARVWDAATGEPVTPPLKHGGPVMHVAFSPDGRWLASASDDGTARVWSLDAGQFTVEHLELLSQVLSAQKIHARGAGLEPVDSHAMSNAWRTLRAKYPELSVVPGPLPAR